jgi:hypothetical protein
MSIHFPICFVVYVQTDESCAIFLPGQERDATAESLLQSIMGGANRRTPSRIEYSEGHDEQARQVKLQCGWSDLIRFSIIT